MTFNKLSFKLKKNIIKKNSDMLPISWKNTLNFREVQQMNPNFQ